jgi:hypothetical protein
MVPNLSGWTSCSTAYITVAKVSTAPIRITRHPNSVRRSACTAASSERIAVE